MSTATLVSSPIEFPTTELFQKNIGYISILVLLILLLFIFWYAYKTNKLVESKEYLLKNANGVMEWFLKKTTSADKPDATVDIENEYDEDETSEDENS